MISNLAFPAVYRRGEGVLAELGGFCKTYGQKVVLIGGHQALASVADQATDSLRQAGLEVLTPIWYGGECTWANVDKMEKAVLAIGAEVLIAVGGGRAIDTVKATGFRLNLPVVAIPTIGATCAAMTPLSIINDVHGAYIENSPKATTPIGVFVDVAIIAQAPARWLYAGLGDTLAKRYEYRSTGANVEQTASVIGAMNNSHTCYDIIKRYGKGAKQAVLAQIPNADLGYALDAIIYYAGMCSILGGEKLRGAAAHCVYFGFSNIPEAHQWGHGLLVGFGNLCLLAIEERSDEEIKEEIKLAVDCGVPVTLAQIAILSEADLHTVAKIAVEAPDMTNMPFQVSEQMVIDAIKRVDQLGQQVLA